MSSDGMKLFAAASWNAYDHMQAFSYDRSEYLGRGGSIWSSDDFGKTWTKHTPGGACTADTLHAYCRDFVSITCNGDGSRVLASDARAEVWSFSNGEWKKLDHPIFQSTAKMRRVAMSKDGTTIALLKEPSFGDQFGKDGPFENSIVISRDSGNSWDTV